MGYCCMCPARVTIKYNLPFSFSPLDGDVRV